MEVKELSRTTVCNVFEIRSPIWGGGRRVVGLAENRLGLHNEIRFTYVRKADGEKSFPDVYYFDGKKLKDIDFERQNIKGTTLVLVPFSELNILRRV